MTNVKIGYQVTKRLRRISVYTMPNRHLIKSGLLDVRTVTNLKRGTSKQQKENLKYWKEKTKQSLNLEKSRVIVDGTEYLITPVDGFLAKLPDLSE